MMKHEIRRRANDIENRIKSGGGVEDVDIELRRFHNEILDEAFVALLRDNLERSAKLVERLKVEEL
jgi:hypothetical protein